MKLVAIYNVWADWDILKYSLKWLRPLVDGVIIVGSRFSNHGEFFEIPEEWHNSELSIREPQFKRPADSETDKRNFGLDLARKAGYTHFLTIDADEFYEPEAFLKEKARFHVKTKGLVCQCQTYFKSPTLTIGLDTTLVPFIHELTPTIRHEFNRSYTFAWIDGKIRIDPTRSLNITTGVERTDLIMHHMSYVRSDFERKIRNSTARFNLERSTIREDLRLAKDGYYCKFYAKHLYTVTNRFDIPDYGVLDENVQSLEAARPKDKP